MTGPGFPNREARGLAGAKNGAARCCLGSKEAAPELVSPRVSAICPGACRHAGWQGRKQPPAEANCVCQLRRA